MVDTTNGPDFSTTVPPRGNQSKAWPLVRLLCVVLGAGLAAIIIWASFQANIFDSFGAIIADPWGVVALVDLYIGFFIAMIFIAWVDGLKLSTVIWSVGLMLLGNLLMIVWVVMRWSILQERLGKRSA